MSSLFHHTHSLFAPPLPTLPSSSSTSSPIQTLPSDILRLTFLHATSSFPDLTYPLPHRHPSPPTSLLLICPHWTSLALSTPLLWSTLPIHLNPSSSRKKHKKTKGTFLHHLLTLYTRLIPLYLARSHPAPLTILLEMDGHCKDTSVPTLLTTHAPRWQNLEISVSDASIPALHILTAHLGKNTPLLRTLKLGLSGIPPPPLYLPMSELPLLKEIDVNAINLKLAPPNPTDPPTTTSLTHLSIKVSGASAREHIPWLRISPNLTHLSLAYLFYASSDVTSDSPNSTTTTSTSNSERQPLSLPHLQSLTLTWVTSACPDTSISHLLTSLPPLPSLSTLSITRHMSESRRPPLPLPIHAPTNDHNSAQNSAQNIPPTPPPWLSPLLTQTQCGPSLQSLTLLGHLLPADSTMTDTDEAEEVKKMLRMCMGGETPLKTIRLPRGLRAIEEQFERGEI